MVLMVGMHSMLEYPLWYAFFLAPTALLLGIGDVNPLRLALAPRARLIVGLVLFGGGAALFSLRFDYVHLENAVNPWLAGRQRLGTWEDLLPMVGPAQRRSLIYPYLCVTAVTRLGMPPQPIDDALRTSDCAMRVMPIDRVMYRRALVLAFAGRDAEAETTWRLALRTYPAAVEQAIGELKAMGAEDAASPLQALLRLAEASRSSAAKQSR